MRKLTTLYILVLLLPLWISGQTVKILFDCTKAETAGNADWVIDADAHNIDWESNDQIGTGTASNPQRYPTPLQNTVTSSTAETYWEGSLSSWGIDCVNYGYEVETLPPTGLITYGDVSNPQDLSNYKVYVIDEPNIRFSTTEKTAILNFVKNGGGLFMISDHNISDRNNDGWDSPNIWNDFLNTVAPINPFGIKFDLQDFSPSTTNVSTNSSDSLTRGPYGSVTKLTYSGATIIHIYPDSNSTATGDIWMSGVSQASHDSIMFAHAHFGSGKVAAIADSSPEDDGTGNPAATLYSAYSSADNGSDRKLLMNAIIWLAEGSTAVVTDSLRLVTATDTTVCSGNSVTMTATGATTYSWSPGGATTASITVQPSATGLYIVTGSTAGISKYDTVKVTVDQFASTTPQISAGGPVTFCIGGNVVLSAPSESFYHWSNGTTTQNITATQAGIYTVSLTDANGCKTNSNNVTVTVDGFPQTTPQINANGPLTFCGGNSVVLTAPAQSSYTWSNGATTQNITATQSGSYIVSLTDANGCHATSNAESVSVDAFSQTQPQITTNGPLSFCTGGSVVLSAPVGYTYHWNNGSTQQTVTASQSGIFFLTVTDGNNCTAKSDTSLVAVSASITGVQISPTGLQTICSGSSISLSAPAGYTSYQWSTGATNQSISVSLQGSYYLTVSSGGSCHGVSDTAVVNVDAFSNTTPQLTASGAVSFCQGGNVILSSQVAGTYQWSTGSSQSSLTVSQTGNYHATITDANNCSAVSQSITVMVNPLPQLNFQINADSVCSTAGSLLLSATPTGGSFSGIGVNGTQFEPSVAGAGTFPVTYNYTDSNGCTNISTAGITVYTCLGIEELDNNTVSVYPNPSSGEFIFETEGNFKPEVIRVYDDLGRLVKVLTGIENQTTIRIELKDFASGIYLALLSKNNTVVRKKLVKTE